MTGEAAKAAKAAHISVFFSTGKIQWARSLFLHLEEPMMFFKDHAVLLKMPEGKEAVRKYNRIGKTLVQYELAYYDAWRKQSVRPTCISSSSL